MANAKASPKQQVHIRLPAGLHAELVRRAEAHAIPLNTVITLLLADAVGWSAKPEASKRGKGS